MQVLLAPFYMSKEQEPGIWSRLPIRPHQVWMSLRLLMKVPPRLKQEQILLMLFVFRILRASISLQSIRRRTAATLLLTLVSKRTPPAGQLSAALPLVEQPVRLLVVPALCKLIPRPPVAMGLRPALLW